MILYYALGGGYGHFIRAVDFLYTVFPKEKALILCSQIPKGAREQIPHKIEQVKDFTDSENQKNEWIAQLEKIISENNVNHLILDTFPIGIFNELEDTDLTAVKVSHVARYIKPKAFNTIWENHFDIQFETTFFVEEVSGMQAEVLQAASKKSQDIDLQLFDYNKDDFISKILQPTDSEKILVVHSGNADELEVLLNFAKDLNGQLPKSASVFCISPNTLNENNIVVLPVFPAHAYYHLFDYVVSGAGFNSVRFAHLAQKKSYFIPFERKYDDQFWRLHQFRQTLI